MNYLTNSTIRLWVLRISCFKHVWIKHSTKLMHDNVTSLFACHHEKPRARCKHMALGRWALCLSLSGLQTTCKIWWDYTMISQDRVAPFEMVKSSWNWNEHLTSGYFFRSINSSHIAKWVFWQLTFSAAGLHPSKKKKERKKEKEEKQCHHWRMAQSV